MHTNTYHSCIIGIIVTCYNTLFVKISFFFVDLKNFCRLNGRTCIYHTINQWFLTYDPRLP